MLKRLSFYLALAGIVAVTFLVLRLRQPAPSPEPLVPPPVSPYAASIGGRGLVESIDENIRIAPPASGLVERVLVSPGDSVGEGADLFQLDSRDAQASLRVQQAQVGVFRAQVAEAETLLADRKDQLDRSAKLRERRVASEDEAERDRFAWESASRQLERVRADLALAEAKLQAAQVALDMRTVKAPRPARVLQVNIRPGEYTTVDPAAPALLLGDVSNLQLRVDVDESDAPRVRSGAAATAFLKGTREKPVALDFVRIEPYILPKKSLTGESTERVDTRVLQVIYRLRDPSMPVYVGQQMDVFIDG